MQIERPTSPETEKDRSEELTRKLEALGIFETVKVKRYVRAWKDNRGSTDAVQERGYIVSPDDPFLGSPKHDQSQGIEEVYVGWFTQIFPEDRANSGLKSGWLTDKDKSAIAAILPPGLKLDPIMSPGTPERIGAGNKAPVDAEQSQDEWNRDNKEGRRRGTFLIETDAVRREHLKREIAYVERSYAYDEEGLKRQMERIKRIYGDLIDQKQTDDSDDTLRKSQDDHRGQLLRVNDGL